MGEVHLVTILYRSESALPAFLDSLAAQDLSAWRLHVIDNASPDESRALVEARADRRITVQGNAANLGFARAANQGIAAALAAGATWIVLLNNDTRFAPDFLRRLAALKAATAAPVLAPRVMRQGRPGEAWYAGGALEDGWVFGNLHHAFDAAAPTAPVAVDFAPGCCLAIDVTVFARAGLFDERFFVYWEDTDFCLRLKRLGIPILYAPELSLDHEGGAASGGEFSPAYIRLYYRSYMQFVRKHFGLGAAIRTMLRLLARERTRPGRRDTAAMARAMLGGPSHAPRNRRRRRLYRVDSAGPPRLSTGQSPVRGLPSSGIVARLRRSPSGPIPIIRTIHASA